MNVRRFAVAVSIAAVFALSGCATQFQGSAPASDGKMYVVGAKQVPFVGIQPMVWICPEKSPGECEEVKVRRK